MKSNTRMAILETSKELFSQKGFKATTIRDIANHANVAISSISYHFEGKDGILLAIIEEIQNLVSSNLFNALEGEFSSIEEVQIRLKIFINNMIVFGIKNWNVIKILLTESYELRKFQEIQSLSSFSLVQLENFLKKAKQRKMLKKVIDEKLLADYLMALVMDQILQWKSKKANDGIDLSDIKQRESWVKEILNITLFGVAV
jgi:AcrR family transcriptional regulator